MIDLRHVSKSFGPIRAVTGVTFEVHTGQCVGLLGPNGAGKSTTIRMITGYIPPSSGSIRVGGHDTVADSLEARRMIGYLPEATPLYPEMRVEDFLAYRARLYGLRRGPRRTAMGKAMDLCRITNVGSRRIGQLSKGYKQRVGLASTLLHDPRVLILDEPTSGLDPSQIRETRSLIKDLAANRTVLVSSHILPEVEKTCDRVIIMAGGTVRADGPPESLVRRLDQAGTYVAEVHAEPAKVGELAEVLGRTPGITAVSLAPVLRDGAWSRLTVCGTEGGADLRETIGRIIAASGLPMRELTRIVPTLEHVFMRLVEADEFAEGALGASARAGVSAAAEATAA